MRAAFVVLEATQRKFRNFWRDRVVQEAIANAKIPYVSALPDGRRLKTDESLREIPLVGAALAALKANPEGFPRYRDNSSTFSATANKFLLENGLRPTEEHTVYSLRHSFKDRLIAAEAQELDR